MKLYHFGDYLNVQNNWQKIYKIVPCDRNVIWKLRVWYERQNHVDGIRPYHTTEELKWIISFDKYYLSISCTGCSILPPIQDILIAPPWWSCMQSSLRGWHKVSCWPWTWAATIWPPARTTRSRSGTATVRTSSTSPPREGLKHKGQL